MGEESFQAKTWRRARRWVFRWAPSWTPGSTSSSAAPGERRIPLRPFHESPLIDTRRGHPYVPNTIRTSRYTIYDFLPKQLIFQFTRLGNFYFLCVGVPQTIPGLSTTGNVTTILPLMFFVLFTIAKEGYDDYKRHRLDEVENANRTTVLRRATPQPPGRRTEKSDLEWRTVKWRDVVVGDIVKLERDDPVPADLILLHASGEDGLAYMETMALDGETNLKTKHRPSALDNCGTVEDLSACNAEFVVENPNRDLYRFDGKLTANNKTVPLTLNELLHRGSTLRNTECAIGMVINTGEECKIRMNANHHPKAKKPALESIYNKIILALAIYMVLLSVGCTVGYVFWQRSTENAAYYLVGEAVGYHEIIIGYLIQFNNVIPLSLFVSLEIIKLIQMFMLNSDLEIYDETSDTPTRCNTNTILENLGQISYVLTDKTGTLTENVLKFRKMSVAGTSWSHPEETAEKEMSGAAVSQEHLSDTPAATLSRDERRLSSQTINPRSISPLRRSISRESYFSYDPSRAEMSTGDMREFLRLRPQSLFSRKARSFILAMALCHTCLPEERGGKLDYQASSADELALVRAAKELGYSVSKRSPRFITLQLQDTSGYERSETYEILDVIEFSSKRKRFSIIVKHPDGRISLICKGADSVLLPRLAKAQLALNMAKEAERNTQAETEFQQRMSEQQPRNSFGGRPSLTIKGPSGRKSYDAPMDTVAARSRSMDLNRLGSSLLSPPLVTRSQSFDIRGESRSRSPFPGHSRFAFLDDPTLQSDETVFRRCFQHLEDYARDGLRTLIYAQRIITPNEYKAWKKVYHDATTSLVDRQVRVEEAAEIIEQQLDLIGASAIEDRLQDGVPATIDKLRRANIRIWMLTGDKRETAINIAHSAQICRPESAVLVLDAARTTPLDRQLDEIERQVAARAYVHTVVVVDGNTLGHVNGDADLRCRLFDLLLQVNSVICCRASPAQKAQLVREIRSQRCGELTLAIGDGANDVAMIQEADVGVGISGGGAKEGLQAARVADFSIAQFRFLGRLLLVHGRWNYSRTAKFVLATFWKEAFFYLPTVLYQRYNGYTGTSLYEMASLTVLNIFFSSLCVIVMGIWEQELCDETLLAVPELYVHGQRDMGLNLSKYLRWMVGAAIEGVGVWWCCWAGYGGIWGPERDEGLFALGDLAFSVAICWTNIKLFILETHHKTSIVITAFFVTIAGWWAWNAILAGIYSHSVSPYAVKYGFTSTFGQDWTWWITLIGTLMLLLVFELAIKAAKWYLVLAGWWRWEGRLKWPPWKRKDVGPGSHIEEWKLELWQELEQIPAVRDKMRRMLGREKQDANGGVDAGFEEEEELEIDTALPQVSQRRRQ